VTTPQQRFASWGQSYRVDHVQKHEEKHRQVTENKCRFKEVSQKGNIAKIMTAFSPAQASIAQGQVHSFIHSQNMYFPLGPDMYSTE
jgi:hypothetical protein